MLAADAPETPVKSEKCILYLFELGANPKAADANGDTAAHLAARRDHLRLLALLSFDAKWLRNDNGATPLMEAARTGSWKCAKHLLHLLRQAMFNECRQHGNSKRSRLLKKKDLEGRTASDLARLSGHSELASYIEREMRLVVDADGEISGLTAQEEAERLELQRLAKAGDLAGLRRAATRDSCDLPDNDGCTALMWAAENSSCGDEALWEQLVQLGDPTCADVDADSILLRAARAGNSAAASALLSAGASANATSMWEFTLLMSAAICARPSAAAAVGRVLLDSGADWSLKDRDGRTALDLATQKGKSELAELLRFGEVHEVRTDTGVTCAAKTLRLPVQLGDDQTSVSTEIHRAVESERNLCRLRHPNIVRFLHIAQPEPAAVVVFMELLDGRSLERFIDNKPLDEPKIRDFSEQICRALLYLHSRQPLVIHRDINCSNIIVCADNTQIKLIDFGLSIKLEQSVSHISASTPSPKGTLNFMAPELLGAGESDSLQYSRESDIWAFGCSVFQMASGVRPFANAKSLLEMAQLIDRKGVPALPDGRSAELRDFYSRCTAKDRRRRRSAHELLEHEFLTGRKLQPGFFSSFFSARK
uniref:Protein kinase domain-containing protein n=1 Tax=Macrostomum lignano TaxID=282301 RepID=A0A1I8IEV7_9PLAT